jgi:hypothetical protein
MSENHPSANILTKTRLETAIEILGQSLEILVKDYDFGFRGYGGAVQLVFDEGEYDDDIIIHEQLLQRDFNRETAERLAREYGWFSLEGSIYIPGSHLLWGLDVVLYPTFDEAFPACVLFGLDSGFLESVYGRQFNTFNPDAADRLLQLSVALGANELVDGFMTDRLPSLAEVPILNAELLRKRLLEHPPFPASVEAALVTPSVGLVTGIKTQLVPLSEIQKRWPRCGLLQTITGFSILSTVVKPPKICA